MKLNVFILMEKKPHQFHLTTFIQIIVAKLKYTWKGVTNYFFYCQIVKQIHIDCSYKRFPIVTFTVGQVSLIGHIKLKTAWSFDAKCLSLVPDDASEMKSNWDNALALTNLEHAATSHHFSSVSPASNHRCPLNGSQQSLHQTAMKHTQKVEVFWVYVLDRTR